MGGCTSKDGVTGAAAKGTPSTRTAYKEHADAASLEDVNTFFKPETDSALSRNLTQEIWNEYKDQQCASGVTFKTCCFSGVANLDSGIGLYAGSHDSYSKFSKLFDKVVEEYHGHGPSAKHVSCMDASGLKNADFTAEDAAMVASTRIRVGRNLAGYPLGPGVTKEQRLEIMNKVVDACSKFEGDLAGTFYPLEGMSEDVRQQLVADHFLFKEGDRFLKACNLNRDWPSGRGIFHNDAKTFLVWVNEEDQLRIISMQKGAGIAEVFDRLCRAATAIEKIAKFAHDGHLGYITSCPTNLGTALRGSVHIKLPKLAKQKEQFQKIADQYHVQIRGIHGEHSESDDGTYDISNKRRLGMSEAALVQDMIDGVHALISAERALPE
jgi:creatine kinase/arginine kinase